MPLLSPLPFGRCIAHLLHDLCSLCVLRIGVEAAAKQNHPFKMEPHWAALRQSAEPRALGTGMNGPCDRHARKVDAEVQQHAGPEAHLLRIPQLIDLMGVILSMAGQL